MLAINRLKRTVIASLLLLTGAANAMAQQPRAQSTAGDFSIEILQPNGQRGVLTLANAREHAGYSFRNDFTRIADWKPSGEVPSETAVLRLQVWLEELVPQIEIFVYLGKATQASMEEWEKLPKVKVMTRALLLDETVTTLDTERFGIVPFKLRAFKAQPWSIGPPTVTNKTNALTVVLPLTENRPHYTITVKNLSHRSITALSWYGLENGRRGGDSGISGRLVIPAGGSFNMRQLFSFAEAPMTPNPADWRPPTREIVIAAILFEDGSYEGEPDAAAEIAANKAGERFQFERAARLWRDLSATPAPEHAAVLLKLKREISALSEEAPTAVVNELTTRFVEASQDTRNRRIKHEVSKGLHFVKNQVRHEIERYESLREHTPADANFETFLKELENLGKGLF